MHSPGALPSSNGVTFDYGIEVASETPAPTLGAIGRFALLGVYVGVIPVALGICWFPFLRRLGKKALDFLLYLTVGLLAFLVVDAVEDGLEIAEGLPGIYHPQALLALGVVGAFLVLLSVEHRARERRPGASNVLVAWLIALGIGLHNLGEGLAIGSAYVLGELTLGAVLVVGFVLSFYIVRLLGWNRGVLGVSFCGRPARVPVFEPLLMLSILHAAIIEHMSVRATDDARINRREQYGYRMHHLAGRAAAGVCECAPAGDRRRR